MNWFKFIGRFCQLLHILGFVVMLYVLVTAGDNLDPQTPLRMLVVVLLTVVVMTGNVVSIFVINNDIKEDEAR